MPNKIPPIEHQFDTDKQPSPEAKSRGWKYKQNLKKYIQFYQNKTIQELQKILDDIKEHPDKYKFVQLIALDAVRKMTKDFRYYRDNRDRSEGKPVQNIVNRNYNSDISELSKDEIEKLYNKIHESDES